MSGAEHHHVLLIGGQRCGTTWLGNLLGAQPATRLTSVVRPEPKFFLDSDDHGRYDALFAEVGGPWWLDKSTTYLERADSAVRARSAVPGALVVVVLRDPVERAYSNWRFSTVNGIEELSFDDSLATDAQARQLHSLSTSPFESLRRGRYAELLRPWFAEFGTNIVVLQYERMTARGGAEYVATRLESMGLEITNLERRGPVNEAPVDVEMSRSARSWLVDYYRTPNAQLDTLVDGIDFDLWQR